MTPTVPQAGHHDARLSVHYTCSYVPSEIILAAGFVPKRILPGSRAEAAGGFLHANTCSYLKCLLATLLEERDPEVGATVLANSCDGARRLADLLRHYRPMHPTFLLDVPKQSDRPSIDWFASELARLAVGLQALPGASQITGERLRAAIERLNRSRRAVQSVFDLQAGGESQATGVTVFSLCREVLASDPQEIDRRVDGFLRRAAAGKGPGSAPRIVLTANILPDPSLIALIEDAGARVVALDTCTTTRQYQMTILEGSPDPMLALAEGYLLKPPCPRMVGIERRLDRLLRLARESAADGVVYAMPKFCDTTSADAPVIQDGFRRSGVPFQLLEYEYDKASNGQTRTRVEAFLEVIRHTGG